MRKIFLILLVGVLVGCSSNVKTRGLSMEIRLEASEDEAWRCYSDNDEVIRITEENFFGHASDGLAGEYQYKFVGVTAGEATIKCIYSDVLENREITNTYYVEVDGNKFINYLKKEGDMVLKMTDPSFR